MKAIVVVLFAVFSSVGVSWSQPAWPLFNETDQVLREICNGNPLQDGTPVCLFWDRRTNGPDYCDVQMPGGSCLFMNGATQGLGAGLFVAEQALYLEQLPQPPRFYLKICLQNIVWFSNTFTLSSGHQDIELESWSCFPGRCVGDLPPPPIRFSTQYDFRCACETGELYQGQTVARIYQDVNVNGQDEQDTLVMPIGWDCSASGFCYGQAFPPPCIDSVFVYLEVDINECCFLSEVVELHFDTWNIELTDWTCRGVRCDGLAVEEPRHRATNSNIRISPNPFNHETQIEFELSRGGQTELNIYEVTGRLVETLVHEELSTGQHVRTWNASGVPSGVYFAQLVVGDDIRLEKLLLLK